MPTDPALVTLVERLRQIGKMLDEFVDLGFVHKSVREDAKWLREAADALSRATSGAGTCATCQHWTREFVEPDFLDEGRNTQEHKPLVWGECHSQYRNPKMFRANRNVCIYTDETFGCTLHEPVPPTSTRPKSSGPG